MVITSIFSALGREDVSFRPSVCPSVDTKYEIKENFDLNFKGALGAFNAEYGRK